MRPVRVCVFPFGIRIERENCTCDRLPAHHHMDRAESARLVKAGDLRRVKGSVYQRTNRKTPPQHGLSARYGEYVAECVHVDPELPNDPVKRRIMRNMIAEIRQHAPV
jgi:hypothetical protein